MKLFVALMCLVGVACAEVSLHAVFQAKWNNFKATHGKAYHKHEEPQRLNAFLENSIEIEQHNERFARGLETYNLAHNEFSDMPIEEFRRTVTTLQVPPAHAMPNVTVYQVPEDAPMAPMGSCDWRHTLGPIKSQGGCGSCYAFASLAPLEAALVKKGNRYTPLSEQQIVDCTGRGTRYGNNGCNGGWMTGVYDYIRDNSGINTAAEYAYKETDNMKCSPRSTRHGKIANYVNVNNERSMTDALIRVGPIAVALQAGIRSFQMYSGGVYNDANCGKGNIDHGVTLVGHGTANGLDYYVIRNSWGDSWGEKGHMRLNRNICHVANYGYYPVL